MISVRFIYDSSDRITGFDISGHAGLADSGYDIICSAVSALAINTVNSIEELTDDRFLAEEDESGALKLNVVTLSDSSELLLKSLYIGIKGIIDEYGSEYVSII